MAIMTRGVVVHIATYRDAKRPTLLILCTWYYNLRYIIYTVLRYVESLKQFPPFAFPVKNGTPAYTQVWITAATLRLTAL